MGERPARTRPTSHFTPHRGWVNDPLAVTWRDGRYHLFFQHVPESTVWAAHCHWGHAVSADLLRWEERPVALRPADDEAGCWSGCVVADGTGTDLLLYTSVLDEDLELGRVRVARPRRTDDVDPWATWAPGEIVVRPPDVPGVVTFRDPFVVADGGAWRMLVGGGLAAPTAEGVGTACVFGFASEDLLHWTYTGLVAERRGTETEPAWTGTKWECPQLLRVGGVDGVDVLVVSVCDEDGLHHVAAAPGSFADGRFDASAPWQRLTYGVPYAGTGFRTRDDRPALLMWLRDVADPAALGGCARAPSRGRPRRRPGGGRPPDGSGRVPPLGPRLTGARGPGRHGGSGSRAARRG